MKAALGFANPIVRLMSKGSFVPLRRPADCKMAYSSVILHCNSTLSRHVYLEGYSGCTCNSS